MPDLSEQKNRVHIEPAGLGAEERQTSAEPSGAGWVFWNPDTGEEYSPDHPLDSGQVPCAHDIRPATEMERTLWFDIQRRYRLGLLVAEFIETPSLHSKRTAEFGRVCRDDLPRFLRHGVAHASRSDVTASEGEVSPGTNS